MKSMSGVRKNEQGMVSILIVMIMIIVISLIVLSFSQVTRRNQREAVDNQLSTQAYYAAESGINAAAQYFTTNPTAAVNTTDCKSFIGSGYLGGVYGTTNVLNAGTNVRYSCLMVNSEPTSLETAPLTQDSNTVWRLANTDSDPFTSLTFQWTRQTSSPRPNICSDNTQFPAYDSWNCQYGILRVDLVRASTITKAALESNSGVTSLYFVPSFTAGSAATTIAAPVAATGCGGANCPAQIVTVSCGSGATGNCKLKLNMIGGDTQYFARFTMLYQDTADLTLTATDATGGVHFVGGQAVVDSTGQAQDELRRVQVRLPLLSAGSGLPAYALSSTDSVCKQLNVGPGIPYTDACP